MESFKDKRIILTGATGLVGSHLVRRSLKEGAHVHIIARSGSDMRRLADILDDVTIHETDISDDVAMREILERVHPDGFFHLAGVSQTYNSVPTTDSLIDINIRASIKLMDAASVYPYSFFVNTSSFVEVGSKTAPIRESDTLEPTEMYGLSRIPAMLYGRALGRDKHKPVVTIRVFTPYGPFLQKGKLVYEVITRALENEPIMLTNPSITRDFIYIDDLVDLYVRAAESASDCAGEVLNGGSGTATNLQSLVTMIIRETDSHSPIMWTDEKVSYDSGHWEADMSHVRDILGWEPCRSLQEGIADTIAWFRANEYYWNSAQ